LPDESGKDPMTTETLPGESGNLAGITSSKVESHFAGSSLFLAAKHGLSVAGLAINASDALSAYRPSIPFASPPKSRGKTDLPCQLHEYFCDASVQPWDPSRFQNLRLLQEAARSNGQVNLMFDSAENKPVAVKKMPTSWVGMSRSDFVSRNPGETEEPWRDLGCLQLLSEKGCSFACEFRGVFRDEFYTYVVCSWATEGDLHTWCTAGPLPGPDMERLIRPVAMQLFTAVRTLHDMSIIHHDLSLENILVSQVESGEGNLAVKLIDFSMASQCRWTRNRAGIGKGPYLAPELHSGSDSCDGFLSDAFALGVVLFVLVVKDYPWQSTKPGYCKGFGYVKRNGLRAYLQKRKLVGTDTRLHELLSEPFAELLQGLLEPDPRKRLTLGEQDFSQGRTRRSVWNCAWFQQQF